MGTPAATWKASSKNFGSASARCVLSPQRRRGVEQSKGALSPPAVIAIESGGLTETFPELHAYRRPNLSAAEARIETVCRAGGALAFRFGGDSLFKQSAQIVRRSA
jgi:hypothetical protein